MIWPSLYVTYSLLILNLLSSLSSPARALFWFVASILMRRFWRPDQLGDCISYNLIGLWAVRQGGYFKISQQSSDTEPPPVFDFGFAEFWNNTVCHSCCLNIARRERRNSLLLVAVWINCLLCDRFCLLFCIWLCADKLPPCKLEIVVFGRDRRRGPSLNEI